MEHELAKIAALLFECAKRGWRVSIEREDTYGNYVFTFRGKRLYFQWSVDGSTVFALDGPLFQGRLRN